MKFLIQIPQLIYAGAEKVLVCFANELVTQGHEVEILEIYERGFLKPQFDSRVTFHAICSKEYTQKYYMSLTDIKAARGMTKLTGCAKLAFSKLVGYRRFAEKLAAKHYAGQEFDVAINYLETEPPTFLLDHIKAKKYFQWIHIDVSHLDDPTGIDAMSGQLARMDGIFCVSEYARGTFEARYPQLAEKTHALYNFFDVEAMRKLAEEPFGYGVEEPVLLSVGRMTEQKQYLRFLDVLARLKDEGYSFHWFVLGTGAQLDAIQEKIQVLNLADRVHLEGLTDNPYKYMKHCDLFVLPSGWEGFPTVTVEAKVLGCPVLATDVPGIREQLVHGETGWIVDNSEDAIYEGLKHLLRHPELGKKLRSNAGMERICRNDEKYRQLMDSCGG